MTNGTGGSGLSASGLPTARWLGNFTLNALVTAAIAAVFASATTIAAIAYDVADLRTGGEKISDRVDDAIREIGNVEAEVKGLARQLDHEMRQIALRETPREDRVGQGIEASVAPVRADTMTLLARTVDVADRTSLNTQTKDLLDRSWEHQRRIEGRLEDARSERVADKGAILKAIQEVADVHARRQMAIEQMVDKLVEEGEKAVGTDAMVTWVELAKFVVTSLELPDRDGLLYDRSVVQEEVIRASKSFADADGSDQIVLGQRVLVAVKAVQKLAHGGVLLD